MSTDPRKQTEKTVVGCLLTDTRAIDALIAAGGNITWFTDADCKRVVNAMLKRYEQGKIAADVVALRNAVHVSPQWLDECVDSVVTVAHAPHYIDLLKGHADIDALKAMHQAITHAVNTASPETVRESKAKIEAILHAALTDSAERTVGIAKAAHDWLDRMTEPEETSTMLDWPVRTITETVGRVDRELIWVVALPSVGKTAWTLQWMAVLAKQGHITSLASLESSQESVASRLISHTAPMDTFNIRQRRADLTEIEAARRAADALSSNIRVTDSGMSLDQLYSWGRAEKRAGSKILIVDNTRHIRMGSGDRVQHMAEISNRMKQLRDDTKLPVVILHHSGFDQNGKEKVSWSSDIEKDADMLIFLRDNDKVNKPEGEKSPMPDRWCVTCDFDKNREGGRFARSLMEFDKPTQTFKPWTVASEDYDDITSDGYGFAVNA